MYLSHGLPRIILTKRIRARSNHASSVKRHSRQRPRPQARPLKQRSRPLKSRSRAIHAKGRARRRDRSNQG